MKTKKNILITGCAGFIGFHFTNYCINSNQFAHVVGIDNLNNYYNVKLKKIRLSLLNKQKKNFKFYRLDLNNKKLNDIFKKYKFATVVNLAAQAGVRYSYENPLSYIDSNISGFLNLLNISNKKKVKLFLNASSSSVYGEKGPFPKKENFKLNPINIYSKSKEIQENKLNMYLEFSKTRFLSLRFFTVFGEWGRPDMLIMKYLQSSLSNKNFFLYNNGNHYRDFTYIDDVIKIMSKLLNLKSKKKHEVFNICSSNPIKILKIINFINRFVKKPKIIVKKKHKADVLKTYGNNQKVKKITKIKKFTNVNEGISKTINWYLKNYKKFEV